MKKGFFLLLFLQLTNISQSQNININEKAFVYYSQINSAEELLINNSYSKAIALYLSNFEENGVLFFKDFTLPFQVALKNGDTSTAIQLLDHLSYDTETTASLFHFLDKINLEDQGELYSYALNSIDSINFVNQNPLKEYIDSMFVLDQIDRENVYDKPWFLRNKKMKEWDHSSKHRIDSIIKRIVELDLVFEASLGFDPYFYYHKKFYTILYHYPYSFRDYNQFFVVWINSGKMHPRHFAWVADFYEKHQNKSKRLSKSIFSYGVFASLSPKFNIEDFSKKKIQEVNNLRLSIGLPTLDHDLRLKKYIRKNKLIYHYNFY